jgi:hypothetical protein
MLQIPPSNKEAPSDMAEKGFALVLFIFLPSRSFSIQATVIQTRFSGAHRPMGSMASINNTVIV